MDSDAIKRIAKSACTRIMDRIEEDRCIHASAIEDEVTRALGGDVSQETSSEGSAIYFTTRRDDQPGWWGLK